LARVFEVARKISCVDATAAAAHRSRIAQVDPDDPTQTTITFDKTDAGTWIATADVLGKTLTAEGVTILEARHAIRAAIREWVAETRPKT
jgi:hypothetical protein